MTEDNSSTDFKFNSSYYIIIPNTSFTTNSTSCSSYRSIDLPKDLVDATDNEEGETYSVININFDAPILDLNVLVDLTHSWLEDLSLYLISPNGDRYLLSSAQGGSSDDYTQTYTEMEMRNYLRDMEFQDWKDVYAHGLRKKM